jgi:hypothetical protein
MAVRVVLGHPRIALRLTLAGTGDEQDRHVLRTLKLSTRASPLNIRKRTGSRIVELFH